MANGSSLFKSVFLYWMVVGFCTVYVCMFIYTLKGKETLNYIKSFTEEFQGKRLFFSISAPW